MASKKKKEESKTPNVNGHGEVDARFQHLTTVRKVRRREAGDGEGIDIGIMPGAFISIEQHLKTLNPATRARMLTHISHHVDEAMKPLLKLVGREGTEYDVLMIKDVGPNMLRTVIEALEDKHQ